MKKILIVLSRYNKTEKNLLPLTLKVLKKKRVKWSLKKVNGAFEIPVIIARNVKKFDGFISLGIIIKGETPNFEFISQAITNGLINLSIENKKPIGNGIITCLRINQIVKRKHKGEEAAEAVLDVLNPKN